MAKLGRQKVAVLTSTPVYAATHARLRGTLADRLPGVPDYWLGVVPPDVPEASEHWVRLLFLPDLRERPDGLLILDDNLVEPACAGLGKAGIVIGEDLEVAAFCNFPLEEEPDPSLRRMGFDLRYVLDVCISLLKAQQEGRRTPPLTTIEGIVEEAT
jgi:DNA-binding LacI/PurR family transcriptional regulator